MKTGDLIRFKISNPPRHDTSEEWKIGLLLEYHTWEKIGTVLYEGKIYRVSARVIQKAGKQDAVQGK